MSYCNTKVVEYLEPLMSKELLCKFPDNSAFDFDYSQSSIWSPLVPRAYSHVDLDSDSDFALPRNLNLEMGFELGSPTCSFQKVTSKKKMKTTGFALNLSALKSKTKNKNNIKKKLVSDFSSTPSFKGTCNPLTKKVWNKVLKAASKHFKKKKKDSTAHVRLFNYIRKENICILCFYLQVWNKVLKAASKHFKKKKKDSTAHVRLFNYIRKENIC